jgi:hypothetical protein
MTDAPPCRSVLWNDRVGTLQAPRNLNSAATSRPFTVENPCVAPYTLSPELEFPATPPITPCHGGAMPLQGGLQCALDSSILVHACYRPWLCSRSCADLASRAVHCDEKTIRRQPPCLENPHPGGAGSTLTENAASPFHAEPKQSHEQS